MVSRGGAAKQKTKARAAGTPRRHSAATQLVAPAPLLRRRHRRQEQCSTGITAAIAAATAATAAVAAHHGHVPAIVGGDSRHGQALAMTRATAIPSMRGRPHASPGQCTPPWVPAGPATAQTT